MNTTAVVLTAVAAAAAIGAASPPPESWPQFGGSVGNFMVPARTLALDALNEPRVRWSRELGEGFSGIAAVGESLFTMYRDGEDEVVVALEAATGRTRWSHALAAPQQAEQDFSQGPGPHATPLVVDEVVCAAGSTARLRCLESATGKLLWSRDLAADHGATIMYRGYSSSPIAFRDSIILQVGGKGHAMMAFDRRTGTVLWTSGDYANTNSSPALIEIGGRQQVVAFMADVIAGFDPETGAELWSHPHPQRFNDNIARPITVGDLLVVTSALDGGTRALRLTQSDGAWKVEERWHQPRVGVYFTNAVVSAGLIVASSGGLGPTFFSAVRPETGELAWQSRDILRSQILAIGGDVLLLRDEEGGIALASVDASGVRVRSKATLFAPGAPSPPTLVGTTVYARDRRRILSLDLSPR